jgi:acetyltransferase-like isoleucine patch superfamily enzyme
MIMIEDFDFLFLIYRIMSRVRALLFWLVTGVRFKSVGRGFKFFGRSFMKIGARFSVGDACWIQAVRSYKGMRYSPAVFIGDGVSLSDAVHISCVSEVRIGSGTLIGSRVYIGDHSHGTSNLTKSSMEEPPGLRPLADVGLISIGDNVWIGDGVVILAGAVVQSGSIIGANSVVKSSFPHPGIIAGNPAVLKREF